MIGIIDYRAGNVRSIALALERSGASVFMVSDAEELKRASGAVIPGVGSFSCVTRLLPLQNALKEFALRKPVLGICLGMQAAFESSEECPGVKGLSLIRGTVKRLASPRLPQMGWNSVRTAMESRLLKGIRSGERFYFANSYGCFPKEAVVVAVSDYGCEFAAAVEKRNFFGVQFHPEKSGAAGLRLIRNFVDLCEG